MGELTLRPSRVDDVGSLRELWAVSFGDSGAYMDNFFHNYYTPERALLLEEAGAVRAMTAWFETCFVAGAQEEYRAGYLYAVATHPDCRGRGFAGRLLEYAGAFLGQRGFHALTTVPAQPSLHRFFGKNGFRECFAHVEFRREPGTSVGEPKFSLEPLEPEEYGRRRERLLAGTAHIAFPPDALTYQAGCCHLSGGGLYAAETGLGEVLLCAEGTEDGQLLLKELLGAEAARARLLVCLPRLLPRFGGVYRCPGSGVPFGMLRWLNPSVQAAWDWNRSAYLGLAFD